MLTTVGCFQPTSTGTGVSGPTPGSCDNCRHTSGGVGGGGVSSASGGGAGTATAGLTSSGNNGGTSSGGGSIGGNSTGAAAGSSSGADLGTSGGTSGGSGSDPDAGPILVCPGLSPSPEQISCPTGSDPFPSQTVDLIECVAVPNANVEAVAPDGVPFTGVAATSDATGEFALCLPENQAFSIEVQASMYPTTYFAELDGISSDGVGQVPLLASEEVNLLESFIGDYASGDGLIIVKLSSTALCDSSKAGWSLSLALPDGGSFPDGGYEVLYMGSSFVPQQGATSTGTEGVAVIYNIDTTQSNFVVPILQSPAGDTTCQPLNSFYGFTGRVYVAGNSGSLYPILLP
jgi:hypothetical protein